MRTKQRIVGAVAWFLPKRFHTMTCAGCGTPGICNGLGAHTHPARCPDCVAG